MLNRIATIKVFIFIISYIWYLLTLVKPMNFMRQTGRRFIEKLK